MKRFLLLALLLASTLVSFASNRTLRGTIKSNNKGVPNVVVTDGWNTTISKANGEYALETDDRQQLIYYTLPSGYGSPVEQGVPVFYQTIRPGANRYNFDLIKLPNTSQQHVFVVWADPQIADTAEFELLDNVVDDMRETLASYAPLPVHGISCGDMVFDKLALLPSYKARVERLGIPFYQSKGNHDMDYSNLTHESSTKSYESQLGPSYYSFNRGDIHYIVLDDVFYYGYQYHYMGYLDQRQLDWLAKDLKYVPKGSTVVISFHIPSMYHGANANPDLLSRQKSSLVNNAAFYKMLQGYQTHLLAGHSHTQWNTAISDSILEHTHAAASAAWWQGEVGLDGTPKGYTVYEANGKQLTWYFKGVGLSKNHQFKLYPAGADAENPDAFIANVYNYDPQWKVQWYENGLLAGSMEQYWGVDPLAKELYQPGKNKKYDWLSADATNHLFKASPKNKASQITVEVTDRFGNKWKEEVKKK